MKKARVMIGMSGGVDSSVVAALLKDQGYDCVGVYMNLWADPTPFDLDDKKKFPQNKCCSIESLMFARSICQKLGIPFYSINLEETFKENVVEFFLEGFRQGETPNPCVRCNKTVKFGAFFKKMEELGCDFLATGHYARLEREADGQVRLFRGKDESKDQTYFLYNLTQEKLRKLMFPLGGYSKPEVKDLAKHFDLKELEKKKESQGVCFYPEKSYFPFLKRYLKSGQDFEPGSIETSEGKVLGEHEGLPFYTMGQRKGIGVGGGPALYVNKVDSIRNALIVGTEDQLNSKKVELREVNFLNGEDPGSELLDIKIRSHGRLEKGRFFREGEKTWVEFEGSVQAIMAGQSLVIYRDGELLGGGIMQFGL
jgi:tRNA-specific 2-thiouridylase